jgi:hypothetical protein
MIAETCRRIHYTIKFYSAFTVLLVGIKYKLICLLHEVYTEYTQNNGADSMVNKGKLHHSFVYTLYNIKYI